MRRALMASVLAAVSTASWAGTQGGHRADLGLLALAEWPDRGQVVVEGRWNLAPEDPDAALYLTGAVGFGTWIASTRPPKMFSFLDTFEARQDNYTEWKASIGPNVDLGLGASFKGYTGGFGLAITHYSLDAKKVINKEEYFTEDEVSGTKVGVYIQGGYEIPIGHWALCLQVGYRESRGRQDLVLKAANGAEATASVKPVEGPYALLGMRYRFQ